MCGIAGLFGEHASEGALERMLRVVARRGPEGSSTLAVPGGLLAHAALRFVEVGRNPQPLAAGGAHLVWNGELYDWRELNARQRLGARNDTELLAFGLLAHGLDFVRELDGQFAFIALLEAPWRLWVGRDRWGICPLVYGVTEAGCVALASTPEALRVAGVRDVKSVPAGTVGELEGTQLSVRAFYRVPLVREHGALEPLEVRRFALQRVRRCIPERSDELFTTLGGIDSQFVTASVAREVGGRFGGAITVLPDGADAPSDLPDARATLALLASEGIEVAHHTAVLDASFAEANLDRLLTLLGPDLFQILCGLAEDVVAATAHSLGGRVIMTAGGPDEAGRSYDRWTLLHRGLDEELAWHRLAEQFGSSEGVRAGLVFGERGLENRVPLAELIDLAAALAPEHKQRVLSAGDGTRLAELQLETKLFWRRALAGLLPASSLAARKQPIHGSTGALRVLHTLLIRDAMFEAEREAFAHDAWTRGWNGIVFGDLCHLDRHDLVTECQLYTLYRWSKLEPELYAYGGEHRYGRYTWYVPRCFDDPAQRVHKPLCYDWQLGWDVPLRTIR
jgi:asparagine synthetase B (glutamine-hydrolysing)